jgi:hypothetical protein
VAALCGEAVALSQTLAFGAQGLPTMHGRSSRSHSLRPTASLRNRKSPGALTATIPDGYAMRQIPREMCHIRGIEALDALARDGKNRIS